MAIATNILCIQTPAYEQKHHTKQTADSSGLPFFDGIIEQALGRTCLRAVLLKVWKVFRMAFLNYGFRVYKREGAKFSHLSDNRPSACVKQLRDQWQKESPLPASQIKSQGLMRLELHQSLTTFQALQFVPFRFESLVSGPRYAI